MVEYRIFALGNRLALLSIRILIIRVKMFMILHFFFKLFYRIDSVLEIRFVMSEL